MGTLSFTTAMSLDGYIADANGDFQWAAPSEEIFQLHVDRMDAVAAEVLGRKTFELMRYWEREPEDETWGELEHAFARRWRELPLVVVSSTLTETDFHSDHARLVRSLDLSTLAQIVADAPGEVEIFGPTTAAPAMLAGMIHDLRLFIVPKLVGGGLRAFPEGANLGLRLIEDRVFDNGTAYLHYGAS
ncbi:dihydrofolate reductase family protein [Gulosibacter molinativorax]|uniref:Deaminase n=1 Tax=Gulosibacter molinativorax TaxID=256821 RepID=A0ABT7C5M8_9MICO|nr:dihydrofolate reductase family protein [Gulosibacter molinativorax]MDJ1370495.1 deaminase [Gulosibacter molinativorax]QUY62094.1 Putative bifunctional deaminase-reductase [Gulosibacter molinativorax]